MSGLDDEGLLDIFGTRLKNSPKGRPLALNGAKMAAIRRLQGISLDMLAGLTGYTPDELRAIEAGQAQVDHASLTRLAARLECRPEDLLAG
jgi:transcriptional regulator with XRE-family HTH domain